MSTTQRLLLSARRRNILLGGGGRTYSIIKRIGKGGSGEVYQVTWRGQNLAAKVFYPFERQNQLSLIPAVAESAIPGFIKESLRLQEHEYQHLAQASHPSIVGVIDSGPLEMSASERRVLYEEYGVADVETLPVLVTNYVPGTNLLDTLPRLSPEQIPQVLLRIAEALEYLHKHRRCMHLDVAAVNILVRSDIQEPVLVDFALCKSLDYDAGVAPSDQTILWIPKRLLPPLPATHSLMQLLSEGAPVTRASIEEHAFPWLDLYEYGRLLEDLDSVLGTKLANRELQYVRHLSAQLRNWEELQGWGVDDLVPRMRRLEPARSTVFGVPELSAPDVAERSVSIPLTGGVPLTSIVQRIIETPSFRRLALINQLALVPLFLYPAGDYKRSVHALYSYDLARRFVTHLYGTPEFKSLCGIRTAQQLVCVALLHDINHFPLMHAFQETALVRRLETFDRFCDGTLTNESQLGYPTIYELLAELDVSPERFKALVMGQHSRQASATDQVLSSVLNSGVDVDKLSYLGLDAYFTGVAYGSGLDVPALLKAATIRQLPNGRDHLAFTDRAISAVEKVILTRFWNYRAVYWHHTNRAVQAMVVSVARRVFADTGEFEQYLAETLWSGDVGAVEYLAAAYRDKYQNGSIIDGITYDRSKVYKRLYTLHANEDEEDANLFRGFGDLRSPEDHEQLTSALQQGLSDFCGDEWKTLGELSEDEILIDIPGRDLGSGGTAYIALADNNIRTIDQISEPVKYIKENYAELAKRVRIFVSPRVAKVVGERRTSERTALQQLIMAAMQATIGTEAR